MKIPDIKGLFSIARSVLDPKLGRHQVQPAGEKNKADKVELSSQGQTVQRLTAERTDERSRTELVAALQADYQQGELATDSTAVAETMVGDGMFDDIIAG